MGVSNTDWVGILQVVLLVLFTLFIVIGAITTTNRLLRYLRLNEDVPLILWRDVIARSSLAFPFIAIMVVRAFRAFGVNVDGIVNGWPWVLFTSTPAVLGAAIYAYFELFVIERTDGPHTDADYPGNGHSARDLREDRWFGKARRKIEAEHAEEAASASPEVELVDRADDE